MIKFAIFDLDGTLLDSSEMWATLGSRYLTALGKTPETGLTEDMRAFSLSEGAQFLHERYGLLYSPDEILRHLTRMIEHFYTDEVRLKDGAAKLLAVLRAHCVHLSVATAGDERLGMTALSRLGVGDFFAGSVSCSNYGSKTSPDVFLAAADIIHALPEETVVFEDSLFAVKTAKRAGFATAAVKDISESNQTELKRLSDFYAETLESYADNVKDILSFAL